MGYTPPRQKVQRVQQAPFQQPAPAPRVAAATPPPTPAPLPEPVDPEEQRLKAEGAARLAALKEQERKEKADARAAAWNKRKEAFNSWIDKLEPEQRYAMIAAPGFVLAVLTSIVTLYLFVRYS